MPLSNGTGNKAREENIKREIAAGKDPKQAVAIGYAKQRENAHKDAEIHAYMDSVCKGDAAGMKSAADKFNQK